MIKKKYKLSAFALLFLSALLTITSCAQFGVPEGGEDDEHAPVLDKSLSSKNYEVNFDKKAITLTFNEWITLNNPSQEILVSPPLIYPPQARIKKKSVVFEFNEKEVLKDNVTYQINFGNSVKDYTVGNVVENLIYVFSTGAFIDSLSVKGKVVDAFTKEASADITVVMYENLADSFFTSKKPFYFCKTDKEGVFELNNIRADTFQVFALKDDNINYFYDLESELIAFSDSLIILDKKNLKNIRLELFDEKDKTQLVKNDSKIAGLAKLHYINLPEDYIIDYTNIDTLVYEKSKDTLLLWYVDNNKDGQILISHGADVDTIILNKLKSSIKTDSIINLSKEPKQDLKFHLEDSLNLKVNKPIKSFNYNLVSVSDTNQVYNINDLRIEGRNISLKVDSLNHNQSYKLQFLPEGITDIYNNSNKDTITATIKTLDPKLIGKIIFNISGIDSSSYIFELLIKNKLIDKRLVIDNENVIFDKLLKGNYTLRVIKDLDDNGEWSTGNLKEKRQPEPIKEISLEELKSGWDLNIDVNLKDIWDGT